MRRTLSVVFVLAALVTAFHVGTLHGINLGVEEMAALCWGPPAPGASLRIGWLP